jgi:hypothetical protein
MGLARVVVIGAVAGGVEAFDSHWRPSCLEVSPFARLADHLTTRHQVEGAPSVAQQIDTLKQVDAGRALVTSRLPLTATKSRGRSAQNFPGGCWSTS